jgi:hypothetical protein
MRQSVVAQSLEPGAHDRSARRLIYPINQSDAFDISH